VTDQEIAFMGKMTAGMTHEIKNVLATIKESSGLMQDFLKLRQDASFPYGEKFAQILAGIQGQVARGVEISTRLNRFAHSMDEPVITLDLNEIIDQVVFLNQRQARLKQTELRGIPSGEGLRIETDPFRLQLVLAAAIYYLLDRSSPKDLIILRPRKTEPGAAVDIQITAAAETAKSIEAPRPDLPPELVEFQNILDQLQAQIRPAQVGGKEGLILVLNKTR